MKIVKSFLLIAFLGIMVWGLNTRFGMVPPLGKLLNPVTGLWKNAEAANPTPVKVVRSPSLNGAVEVKYDSGMVPHIFADNDYDLYYTQGFVTAKERLWQMEVQARKAGGSLAELYGRKALGTDRFFRRIGLLYGAENALDSAMKDEKTKAMLQAYSDGVNKYIDQLTTATYPIEYKIYDRKPAKWSPINTMLVLKLLTEQLTGGEFEFEMSNALQTFGPDTLQNLMKQVPNDYPVIPSSYTNVTDTSNRNKTLSKAVQVVTNDIVTGSNNWVVSGSKTATGYPMLANDPHLKLSLPGIWFQSQLSAPGINVYGVSIPGIPGVLIGYNNKVAWGLTNTKADVVDWYLVKFKDHTKRQYWYNNQWVDVKRRVEKFNSGDGKTVTDTILYTHHGPVVYDDTKGNTSTYIGKKDGVQGFAVQWMLHKPSNDLKAFYLLNRASDYEDYRKALAWYFCPAQNIVFASNDQDIAIVSNGRIPRRGQSQGIFLLDGSLPEDDWQGWIPMNELPSAKNPKSGILVSANQSLTDKNYPYYIGGEYALNDRAKRINERLASMQKITADSFRLLQTDSYSEMAADVLPRMLALLKVSDNTNNEMLKELKNWNYSYTRDSKAASLFNEWWHEFYSALWMDNLSSYKYPLPWPGFDRTKEIIFSDTGSFWIDDRKTPETETLADLVNSSYAKAIDRLIRRNGSFGDSWAWGRRFNAIEHISGIDEFSVMPLVTDGAENTINALTYGNGPSWRMVVELGPQVKAYGIMPGGQSGNPGSLYYDNNINAWSNGKLRPLVFLHSRNQNTGIISTLTIKK